MKSNSQADILPIDADGSPNTTPPLDVSSGESFCVQTVGVAAGGGTYSLEGSLDGGTTWINLTKNLKDQGNAGAAIATTTLNTDSIFLYPSAFPGLVRLTCATDSTGTPKAFINWPDTRTR